MALNHNNELLAFSAKHIPVVKAFEGFRNMAYRGPDDIWTCGYGHTKEVTQTTTCTTVLATAWLFADLNEAANCVKAWVAVTLSQNQFDALVDFVFNIGCTRFRTSATLKLINMADYPHAVHHWLEWDHVHGRVFKQLSDRRQWETNLFMAGR